MISLAHCYKLVLIKEQTHVSLALKLNCFSIYLYIQNAHNHTALLNLKIKFLVSN